jgi:hypothetical protein
MMPLLLRCFVFVFLHVTGTGSCFTCLDLDLRGSFTWISASVFSSVGYPYAAKCSVMVLHYAALRGIYTYRVPVFVTGIISIRKKIRKYF